MDFLSEVEKKLDLPPGEKAQVIRELKSHYEELKGELVASGMDAALASQEASRKLGDPADVASGIQAVYYQATWRSAFLTAVPFLGMILSAALYMLDKLPAYVPELAIAALAAVMIAGSVRDLRAGRRSVWLVTWLAVGMATSMSLIAFAAQQVLDVEDPQITIRRSAELLAIAPLALWASRNSLLWMRIIAVAVVLSAILIARTFWISVSEQTLFGILYIMILPSILMMITALRLFVFHPYGNTTQASLFLFAFYVGIFGYPTSSSGLLTVLLLTLIVGAVMACARSQSVRAKLVILALGILVMTPLSFLEHGVFPDSVSSKWAVPGVVYVRVLWLIYTPWYLGRRPSEGRPELVR